MKSNFSNSVSRQGIEPRSRGFTPCRLTELYKLNSLSLFIIIIMDIMAALAKHGITNVPSGRPLYDGEGRAIIYDDEPTVRSVPHITDPVFDYEVPSIQWAVATDTEESTEVSVASVMSALQAQDTGDDALIADGSFASFMAAVRPLVTEDGLEPPYDQARWSKICGEVTVMAEQFTDRYLKPIPEMARIIYLDLDDSLLDESEVCDWTYEDTSDGYDCSAYSHGKVDACWQTAEEPVEDRALPLKPEPTLGDRYMLIEEEFSGLPQEFDVTLNLMQPVERRVQRVVDTMSILDSGPCLEGPCFLDRVTLESVEAAGHHMLPTHAFFDDTYYQALEESADYSTDIQRLKIKQTHVDWYKDPDQYFEPKMTVGSFSRRIGTQKTVLTALKKRNADVPELGDVVDIKKLASTVAAKFMAAYVNSQESFHDSLNVLSRGLDYHKKHGAHKDLLGVTLACEVNLQKYQHMIKTDVKPVVTDTLHVERAVPATITFHGKGVTSCFSPFFTACFEKFSLALKKRFLVPIGKISSLEIKNVGLNGRYFLEADLSKFDKSQGELHLEFQREILLRLGFPSHLANWWSDFHRQSYLSDPQAGVSMPVSFQRRTGDAFTYFGNTIVTMAMMAYCFDMATPELAIFSGDDSLLVCSKRPVLDTDVFSALFNMEIKVMEPSLPYVCSKFLLETEAGDLVSVPDPLREIQRMAKKKILKDREMLRAHFISFKDRMRFISSLDERMISMLCRFTSMKYQKTIDSEVRRALAAFAYYSENFVRFSMCYVSDGANVVFQRTGPYIDDHPLGDGHCETLDAHVNRAKDGGWFHNWTNPVFPSLMDKVARTVGDYSRVNCLIGWRDRLEGHKLDDMMNASLRLALDRRDHSRSKERVAYAVHASK